MARIDLSRTLIVDAAIRLLDSSGEGGLTFRALAEHLSTGPGALYGYVANKSDLMTAACDVIVARALPPAGKARPDAVIRAVAEGIFDAMDAHPWVGSALTQAPGQMPAIRILERLGQAVRALGVPARREWTTVSALMSYILGVGGQNAANAQSALTLGADRGDFLGHVAAEWSSLDAGTFPFTRSMASQLRKHDDRVDFLAGIDLMLSGVASFRPSGKP